MDEILADLRAEQDVLDRLLSSLSPDEWTAPTPAAGWTVTDTVRHLLVSEVATEASARHDVDPLTRPPDVAPVDGADLAAAWRAAREGAATALAELPAGRRVPWGGRRMAPRSLLTARLMECWAHGLDCFDAVGRPAVDTDRLRHVALLGWRTLPHAFARAGTAPPAPPELLRLELRLPGGATWTAGPPDGRMDGRAVIRGDAGDWCRVVTHRLRPPRVSRLVADGELATAALRVARAFL